MQVAAVGAAGVADEADRLAGVDVVALVDEGGVAQVHVGVVVALVLAVDDDVVARARLVVLELDDAAAGRDERGPALGEGVLALVPAAAAERSGAGAQRVRAADREDVALEEEGAGSGLARGGVGGAWAEDAVAPEAAVAKTRKK